MELSLWANHPKDQPSLLLRSAFPKTDLYEGRRTPSVAIKLVVPGDSQLATLRPTLGTNRRSFWALSSPTIRTYCGLAVVFRAASPLLIPPNQNYNSWGAVCITLRAIAFNSYRQNLLTV